ncbi:hypothetical protein WMY93_012427 [Mugilogobius chulae]|uniref:G-protein coupled receptors family 1 profile domain-containing protein n=1 Tax=Mugilogobius chulae TaxID=88201 RepID=A0AAW0PGR7_9GOBI
MAETLNQNAGTEDLVGMGLRVSVSPAQTAFYIILVMMGILGNATVVGVIGKSVVKDRGGGRNSDIIIINMSLSNLLVSVMRNTLLIISDVGLQTLMLVSSTTRPLLGCVWNFPSRFSGLAYATTSMVIHETIPIILMALTNLASLYTLYTHGKMRGSEAPMIKRVPAERRAAKVILALIMLFIASWGTSIISVNYFNYNRGASSEFLLVIARFANIIFIAFSPGVLAIGHRRLRSFIKSLLSH